MTSSCEFRPTDYYLPPEPDYVPPISVKLDTTAGYTSNIFRGDHISPVLNLRRLPMLTGKTVPAVGQEDQLFNQAFKVQTPHWMPTQDRMDLQRKQVTAIVIPGALIVDTLNRPHLGKEISVAPESTSPSIIGGQPIVLQGKAFKAKPPKPTAALPPLIQPEINPNLKHLTVDQGLTSGVVSGLTEDKNGYIWISYWSAGISKYDGKHFWHFSEDEGLMQDDIWTIYADSHGYVWMGTLCCGIIRFDGQNFTRFSLEEGFPFLTINTITEDEAGKIWISSPQGIARFDGQAFTFFTTNEGLVGNDVERAFLSRDGQMCFQVKDAGLSKFNGRDFTNIQFRNPVDSSLMQLIAEDRNGHLWFLEDQKVIRFDGRQLVYYPLNSPAEKTTFFHEQASGNIWFVEKAGNIYQYDGRQFRQYAVLKNTAQNDTRAICRDQAGRLLAGFFGGGIFILDAGPFTGHVNIDGTLKYSDGKNIWFAHQNGLKRYRDGAFHFLPLGADFISIRSALEDRQGRIWIGTEHGIMKYERAELRQYFAGPTWPLHRIVHAILEDRRGNIWFGDQYGRIIKYDGRKFTTFSVADGIPPRAIHDIVEDKAGNLWFASFRGGLLRYSEKQFKIYSEKEGLFSNEVVCLLTDDQNNIWIGTQGSGLVRFDGSSFEYFTKKQGLTKNHISALIQDKYKRIWAGTDQGLNLLVPTTPGNGTPASENQASTSSSTTAGDYQIYQFSKQDGLLNIEFGWNEVGMTDGGSIWWGQSTGITRLHPSDIRLPAPSPAAQLEQVYVRDQLINDQPEQTKPVPGVRFDSIPLFTNYPLGLELSHLNNDLTFYFSALDWSAPHQITYSYQLDGLQDYWSTPSSETKADFRGLPPGEFTFKVRARGQSPEWGEAFTYTFEILPPWWKTTWAYLAYFLILCGVIFRVYHFLLKRQLEKQETQNLRALDQFKNQLYTNITHEFRTPLTVIRGMIDQVVGHEKIKQLVKRNTADLLNLVNQMLDLRKVELGHLQLELVQADLVSYLRYTLESFESLASRKHIHLHFHTNVPRLLVDFDQERLLRVLSNLIANAVKFTPEEGTVILSLEVPSREQTSAETLKIIIEDNGIGIPEEEQTIVFDRFYQSNYRTLHSSAMKQAGVGSGNLNTYALPPNSAGGTGIGLALAKELVTLMGGQISLASKPGEGAKFTINLPISRQATPQEITKERFGKMSLPHLAEDHITGGGNKLPEEVVVSDSRAIRLLIIEDNEDLLQYLTSLLETKYRLFLATNGKAGLELALKHIPELIISDVMMPEMDGFEVCSRLKQDERTSHIPIILLTAKVDAASRLQGLSRGADAYLAKPFDPEELFIRLKKLHELRQMLLERYRHWHLGPLPQSEKETFRAEDRFMQRLQETIKDNMGDPEFGTQELCNAMAISRTHLHMKVKALTNRSTSNIIRTIRLYRAKELLKSAQMNVNEVAYDVGFKDPSYFTRKFKEEFGVTPKAVLRE